MYIFLNRNSNNTYLLYKNEYVRIIVLEMNIHLLRSENFIPPVQCMNIQ